MQCLTQMHNFYKHPEPYPVHRTLHGLNQHQGGEPHRTLNRAAGDGHCSLLGNLHGDRPGIYKLRDMY